VDELILELAAGGLDVPVGRRQPVAAHHEEREHVAEPAAPEARTRALVARVESALEADLQPAVLLLHVLDDLAGLLDPDGDRLLAERGQTLIDARAS